MGRTRFCSAGIRTVWSSIAEMMRQKLQQRQDFDLSGVSSTRKPRNSSSVVHLRLINFCNSSSSPSGQISTFLPSGPADGAARAERWARQLIAGCFDLANRFGGAALELIWSFCRSLLLPRIPLAIHHLFNTADYPRLRIITQRGGAAWLLGQERSRYLTT